MTPAQAAERFRALLHAEHANPEDLAPQQAWRAFERFAAEELDGLPPSTDQDRLLFEAGPTKHGGPGGSPAYMVEFERQYDATAGPSYQGMCSILCSFAFPMDGDIAQTPATQLWGVPGAQAADWANTVEATPAFALLAREPIHGTLEIGFI
jgi:hypothetical protein